MNYKKAILNFWTFAFLISNTDKRFHEKAIKMLKVGFEMAIFQPYQTVMGAISKLKKSVLPSASTNFVMWRHTVSMIPMQFFSRRTSKEWNLCQCFLIAPFATASYGDVQSKVKSRFSGDLSANDGHESCCQIGELWTSQPNYSVVQKSENVPRKVHQRPVMNEIVLARTAGGQCVTNLDWRYQFKTKSA